MSIELADSNVVVAAKQFNPSIMGQLWLVKAGIVLDDAFREGCIFTEVLAQVQTDEFDLLVIPPRVQFVAKVEPEQQQALIVEKVGRLVRKLPETPYQAVGFNLNWHLIPERRTFEDYSRYLCFAPESPVHREFDTLDARFGSYLSKDSLGCRLRLEVKPVILAKQGEERQNIISFSFNYHLDVTESPDPVGAIEQALPRWNEAVDETSTIVRAAEE